MNVKSKKELEQVDFLNAINKLGIGGADVCVHASVKSFGAKINCGIKGIVQAFLLPTIQSFYLSAYEIIYRI